MTIFTQAISRLLLPPLLVVAAAVLVKGYSEVGDGFSAGVIAAFGILLQYVAFGHRAVERLLPARAMLTLGFAGLLIALLVTFVPMLWGAAVMTHYPGPNEPVTHLGALELHTAVLFDVGVFLIVFGFSVGAIDYIAHVTDRSEP